MPRLHPPDPNKQHPPAPGSRSRQVFSRPLDAALSPEEATARQAKAEVAGELGKRDKCICQPYPCTAEDWLTCKRCTCEGPRCTAGRGIHCRACKVAGPLYSAHDLRYLEGADRG